MCKVRAEDKCCGGKESLARKKDARSRKKARNVTIPGCCTGKKLTCSEISKLSEEPSTPLTCGKIAKKKPKRLSKKSDGCPADIDKLFPMIKPTLSEREKYFNINHLICILEADDLIRLREIQRIRKEMQEIDDDSGSECEMQVEEQTSETGQSVHPIASSSRSAKSKALTEASGMDQTVNETASSAGSLKSQTSSVENGEKNDLTVGGKTSKQIAENKNREKKVKMATGKSTLGKIECSSICSFDSEVDLSGLHLTKEDVEKIERNREQIRQQQKSEKSDSCTSQN